MNTKFDSIMALLMLLLVTTCTIGLGTTAYYDVQSQEANMKKYEQAREEREEARKRYLEECQKKHELHECLYRLAALDK